MWDQVKGWWKAEPLRLIFIVAGTVYLFIQQLDTGVDWVTAFEVASAWTLVEFGRFKVFSPATIERMGNDGP